MTDKRRNRKPAGQHTCVIFPASVLDAMREAKRRQSPGTILDDEPETFTERRPVQSAERNDG